MKKDALPEYTIPSNPEDIKQLKQILVQCFNTSLERNEIYFNRIGIDQFYLSSRSRRRSGNFTGSVARNFNDEQSVSFTLL